VIKINLLPPEERLPKWRVRRIFSVLSLAVIILLSLVFGVNAVQLYFANKELQAVSSRYMQLGYQEEQMQQANALSAELNQRKALRDNLSKGQVDCFSVLAQISAAAPSGLWLSGLEVQGASMKVQGMTKDYSDLVTFMQNLAQSQEFNEPVLVKSERDGKLPVNHFELTVKIRGK
jgi:type IV pilus assembly protein PilN